MLFKQYNIRLLYANIKYSCLNISIYYHVHNYIPDTHEFPIATIAFIFQNQASPQALFLYSFHFFKSMVIMNDKITYYNTITYYVLYYNVTWTSEHNNNYIEITFNVSYLCDKHSVIIYTSIHNNKSCV